METKYITDNSGKKISVILSIKEYEQMMEQLEELEEIKAYDSAIKNRGQAIPVNKAFEEIEAMRDDL